MASNLNEFILGIGKLSLFDAHNIEQAIKSNLSVNGVKLLLGGPSSFKEKLLEGGHVRLLVSYSVEEFVQSFGSEEKFLTFLGLAAEKNLNLFILDDETQYSVLDARVVIRLLKAFREFVFNEKSANVRKGILRAKESGKVIGRPSANYGDKVNELRHMGMTIQKIAEAMNISVGSVHRSLRPT